MSTRHDGVACVGAAVALLACGCTHTLTVRNLGEYRVPDVVNVPQATTIGVLDAGVDSTARALMDGIAAGLQRSGGQVLYPYQPEGGKPADLVAKIEIKAAYKGSGTNFLINFPGFLVWAPAWNGYVYTADLDVHVDLVKGSALNEVVKTLDLPIGLDIRHADFDRTWTEISWFEFGVIAFVGGLVFIKYDSDVTPLLMREIEHPIGEYVAKKILLEVPSP